MNQYSEHKGPSCYLHHCPHTSAALCPGTAEGGPVGEGDVTCH